MFIFGHVGITLGMALAGDLLLARLAGQPPSANFKETASNVDTGPKAAPSEVISENRAQPPANLLRKSDSLRGIFDLRFWAIGSMLPDIIDKPFGHVLFIQTFNNNGRIFSHTLLFLILIVAAGMILFKFKGRLWFLALACGTLMHLFLDSMWMTPETLLWPLLGWSFPEYSDYNWVGTMLQILVHDPEVFITEFFGIAALGIFLLILVRRRGFRAFLKTGRIS